MFLDREFLEQTATAINAAGNRGVKSRFTHPDLSGDGLGSTLGRVKAARVVGDRVIADLHLIESSHTSPEGDLGAFILDMAEQDPDLFGTSIVFRRAVEAENEFKAAHLNRAGKFVSPDSSNAENLPHARLAELRACDCVDEPAANPAGMFTTGSSQIVADADALLDYALGRSDAEPAMVELSFSPRRVKEWLSRWMERTGMEIVARTGSPAEVDDRDDMPDLSSGDPNIVLEWCARQERRESDRIISDIDALAASVAGSDLEAADRRRYG